MLSTADAAIVADHRAFRALLLAFAYPGSQQPLTLMQATTDSAASSLALLIEAVWEPATPIHALTGAGSLPWVPASCTIEAADVIVADGAVDPQVFARANAGTELTPQRGATIIILPAPTVAPTSVRLSGPGIDGVRVASMALRPEAIVARNAACAGFPLGLDCVFIARDGSISAIPRSTAIEVL